MLNRLLFLFFLSSLTAPSFAQDVQWASRLLNYSSQYGEEHYSARQALGFPNALMDNAPQRWSWVPNKESSPSGEYIKVGFDRPARIQQVAVSESLNPGSIERIYIFDKNGRKYKIFENDDPRPIPIPSRIFRHKFPPTRYEVVAVKIELNTKAVPGSNNIDAIAISSRREDIKLHVDELAYSEPVPGPENLGPQINSSAAERLPIIAPDGKTLFFARKYHKENQGIENKDDIWVSYLQPGNQWSRAINLGSPLNNNEHNFVVASNPDGNLLYLANDYRNNSNGVSYSRKEGQRWGMPRTFKVRNLHNKSQFVSYHLSVDGNILLMSVNMDDTYGFRDLYVSFRESRDEWSAPQNLGPVINTVGEESSVFLAADNKTIYFSSNGQQGYGGLDMFISRRVDDTWTRWTKPQNLGKNINTPGDDYSYSIPASGDYAYFASDFHTYGKSDLFRIRLPKEMRPEPVKVITGRIIKPDDSPATAGSGKNDLADEDWVDWDGGTYTAVVSAQESSASVEPEIDGYYAVSEVEDDPREEVDFDESILEDEEAIKDSDLERNPVIQSLLDKLNSVKEDIQSIGKKREEEKAQPSADPELEALKNRYRNMQPFDEEAEAIRERTRQRLAAERAQQPTPPREAPEVETPDILEEDLRPVLAKTKPTPQKDPEPEPEPEVAYDESGDPELDDMRRKFLLLNPDAALAGAQTDDKPVAQTKPEPKPIPDPQPQETAQAPASGDNPFHQGAEAEAGPPETPAKPETPTVHSEPIDVTSPPTAPEIDIDQLEQEVRQELKQDLRDDIIQELEDELAQSVRSDLSRDMQDEIRKNLRDSLETQVSQDIRSDLSDDVRNELRQDMEEDVRQELIAEEKARLENEMRDELVDDIREELKRELSGPVKRELRQDMEYILKKEIEAQLRKELRDQIRKELEAEMAEAGDDPNAEPEYEEVEQDIFLMPVKVGTVIPLNNIFFDANKSVLKEESFQELERAVRFLENNNNVIVEVGGHTNGWCSDEFASELSHDRAEVVAQYFVEHGVPQRRIQWKGYGKTHPIASNKSRAGRRKNQRVELKILEIEE